MCQDQRSGLQIKCTCIELHQHRVSSAPSGDGPIAPNWRRLKPTRLGTEMTCSQPLFGAAQGGWNLTAVSAVVLGVLPSLPGFLATVKLLKGVPAVATTLYQFSWVVGLGVAVLYYCIAMPSAPAAPHDTSAQLA